MKKSIKKACSLALIATSTAALAGVNAAIVPNTYKPVSGNIYAEQGHDTLTMLEVDGKEDIALVGSKYQIPEARLVVNGNPEALTQLNYEVLSPINEKVDVVEGKFDVKRVGPYTINYSIEKSGTTYKASVQVNGQIGKNQIKLEENTNRTLPKYVWKDFKADYKKLGIDKEIYIPKAEVEFVDNQLNTEYTITTTITAPSQKTLTFDEQSRKLNFNELEEGIYSVRYDAKTNEGVYLNSKTEEFTVLTEEKFEKKFGVKEATDYKLKFEYSKTKPTSAEIGEELELPEPKGKIGSEEAPVYYTIEAHVYTEDGLIDVTSQTINGNKFTAKKKYEVGGKTYKVDNGKYLFYYNVTDAIGVKAEKTGFEISGVKDSKAPTIIVADPYKTDDIENIKDVKYKLQENFTNGKNIILKAIFAEDLADDFSELKLTRYIRSTTQSGSSDDKYTDEKSEDKNIFTKDIIFNKTEDFEFNADTMVDGGTLEPGDYVAYYKAEDSAGKIVKVPYEFKIDTKFEFKKAPTVKFKDTFSKSVSTGDKIVFGMPTAENGDDDKKLNTQIMYKYDNEPNWTVIEANKDGKFEIVVNKEGASSLKIRAKSENDAPMTELETNADKDIQHYVGFKYGYDEVDILIKDNKDVERPTIVNLEDWGMSFEQNKDVNIPGLTLTDDLVDYVDVNVYVSHTELVDDKPVTQNFDVESAVIMRTGNTLTLSGAKFYATLAGNYDVVYEIKDAGNNKSYIYQKVTVSEKVVVDEPRFSNLPEALADGKLELGESIELPVPEITGAGAVFEYRVNVEGALGYQLNKETFKPTKEGSYKVIYSLWVDSVEVESERKEFNVEVQDTKAPEVRVNVEGLNDSYAVGNKVLIPAFEPSDISGINFEKSNIVISSNSYTRTIKGSEMADELAKYALWKEEEEKVKNGEMQEGDRQHTNPGKMYVSFDYNELYKVTYTVYDNSKKQNSTVVTHNVKVGDLVKPTITLSDDIVESTVKIDTKLSIDLKKILSVTDDKTENMSASDVEIVVKNTTTGVEIDNIHKDANNGKFEYNIETAGEYTVTFSARDNAGNRETVTRTFTVNEPSKDAMSTTEVTTIVLCCVAVAVLAGSIVYMIISKKKTQAYK